MKPQWWRQASPIGTLTVLTTGRGVQRLGIGDAVFGVDAVEDRDDEVAAELDEYFAGRRRRFTVPVDVTRVESQFQAAVLDRLRRDVAYGETVSYSELAEMAGSRGAARAVGNTMNRNPVPILIPCHRVIAANGSIGGYGASGVPTKRFLLALEGVELPG